MIRSIALILTLLLLIGCATKKVVTTTGTKQEATVITQKETIKEVEQSMITYEGVPSDSAMVKARFVCDSLLNVVLVELETERGKKLVPEVYWMDDTFYVKVSRPIDSLKVYSEYKARHEVSASDSTDIKAQSNTKEVKVTSNWYMKLSTWIVSLLFVASGLYLFWFFRKHKISIQ